MKIINWKCDKCNETLPSNEVYVLSHESTDGHAIIGDTRISLDKHFCRNCFGEIINFINNSHV